MKHKGYFGSVAFDDEAEIFHGEVLGLRDVVTFQGRSVEELKAAFRESIDDYLAFCSERGELPDKPSTGKFLLRVPPSVHRKLLEKAKADGMSLNSYIVKRLETV